MSLTKMLVDQGYTCKFEKLEIYFWKSYYQYNDILQQWNPRPFTVCVCVCDLVLCLCLLRWAYTVKHVWSNLFTNKVWRRHTRSNNVIHVWSNMFDRVCPPLHTPDLTSPDMNDHTLDSTAMCGHNRWSLLFPGTYSHLSFPECPCYIECEIYLWLCLYGLMVFD